MGNDFYLRKPEREIFLPIYLQVASYLRGEIRKGKLSHGTKLPPEAKLAEELGISRMTLRRALKILAQEGFIVQRKGKGTFVVSPLEGVKLEKKVIGLIGSFRLDKKSPDSYISLLLQGIKDALRERVKLVALSPEEGTLSQLYHHNHLEGVILVTPSIKEVRKFRELPLQDIPHVIVGSSFPVFKERNYVFVDTDNVGGSFRAVEYLIHLGHRRIVYVGGNPEKSNSRDRFKGYREALKKYGIKWEPSLVFQGKKIGVHSEAGYSFACEFLKVKPLPTAVFAGGFYLALGVMKAIKDKGLRIPEDISLVGFDDYEIGEHLSPPLTTVRQPVYELGKKAGERILEWINLGKVKERWTILPTELVVRQSCGPAKNKGVKRKIRRAFQKGR